MRSIQSNQTDVTVQVRDGDVLDTCNHAGAYQGTITRLAGEDAEYEQWAILCDKCNAWQDIEGDWYE